MVAREWPFGLVRATADLETLCATLAAGVRSPISLRATKPSDARSLLKSLVTSSLFMVSSDGAERSGPTSPAGKTLQCRMIAAGEKLVPCCRTVIGPLIAAVLLAGATTACHNRCVDSGGTWVRLNCREVEKPVCTTLGVGDGHVVTTCYRVTRTICDQVCRGARPDAGAAR